MSDTITKPRPLADAKRVGMVSLGCPKALVDSERILTRLRADGYAMSPDYAGADVVLGVLTGGGFYDMVEVQGFTSALWAIQELGTNYDEYYNDPALRDPNFSIDDIIPELNEMNCLYQGKQTCMPSGHL